LKAPLLSVIIPVYNARETLPLALDSVLAQGMDDMEIILVDDGSRDDSLDVCRAYAHRHPFIRFTSQQNGGPAAARNTGLQMATGRYVSFVDSEDTLLPGAYAGLLACAGGADLVIAHFNLLMGSQVLDRGNVKENTVMNQRRFLHALARRPGSYYYSALWNKLYSRDLIVRNGLFFDPRMSWGEDFEFNMRFYRHVRKVGFYKEPIYNYRRTVSGQTWRTMFEFNRSFTIKATLYKSLKELYRSAGLYSRYRPHITLYIFNVTISQ